MLGSNETLARPDASAASSFESGFESSYADFNTTLERVPSIRKGTRGVGRAVCPGLPLAALRDASCLLLPGSAHFTSSTLFAPAADGFSSEIGPATSNARSFLGEREDLSIYVDDDVGSDRRDDLPRSESIAAVLSPHDGSKVWCPVVVVAWRW